MKILINMYKKLLNNNYLNLIFTLSLFVLLIQLFYFYGSSIKESNKKQIMSDVSNKSIFLGLSQQDHLDGFSSSTLLIIEYSDLECPWCKKFHNERKPFLLKKYGPEKVSFIFRHFPLNYLHKKAYIEAISLECSFKLGGDRVFKQFLEKIYANTKSNDGLDLSLLPKFAVDLGLNSLDFSSCVDREETKKIIEENIEKGSIQGVFSTPSFAIFKNGKFQTVTSGSINNLEIAIEALLKE